MVSKDVEQLCDKVEPIYSIKYSFSSFGGDIISLFENKGPVETIQTKKILDLPPKNLFLPKSMQVFGKAKDTPVNEYPSKVFTSELSTVWFM